MPGEFVVLLVTGRILSDLRQAAGDLDFADVVVVEIGAVLAFPNGHSMLIGHLHLKFFYELRRRGIGFRKGQCIVEADAGSAPQILAVIRELELPLALLFNRSRLMVLPQAISKSTGLRKALIVFPFFDSRLEALPGVVVLGGEGLPPDIPDVVCALQHFDPSVVVDLSRVPYEEKVSYLKMLLPMLASLRRATGLPHRIVVDEAHYLYLPDVKQLLDLEFGAYVCRNSSPSDLYPDLRKAMDAVVVKRFTNPQEVQTLLTMVKGRKCRTRMGDHCQSTRPSEAAILPGSDEAEGKIVAVYAFAPIDPVCPAQDKVFRCPTGWRTGIRVYRSWKSGWGRPLDLLVVPCLVGEYTGRICRWNTRAGEISRDGLRMYSMTIGWHRTCEKSNSATGLVIWQDVRESMSQLIQERYRFSSDRALYSPATSNLAGSDRIV